MNAATLLERLHAAGAELAVNGEKLRVIAPAGVVTPELRVELAAHKPELLEALRRPSPLAEAAREMAPTVHFTIVETEDVAGDVAFLRRVRAVLEEWSDGSNVVFMRIVTLGGRRAVVKWHALVTRELRLALARLLAERGRNAMAGTLAPGAPEMAPRREAS